MAKQVKTRKNDPARVRMAHRRLGAALLGALLLLVITGFGFVTLLRGGQSIETIGTVRPGDYVRQDVDVILDNIAMGYRGETVKEVYGVAPVNGKLYVFCFPKRWFASEAAVRQQTDAWLGAEIEQTDTYLRVSGTAKEIPDDVAAKARAWLARNEEAMRSVNLIPEGQATEDCVADCVIYVDRVGAMPFGTVILLTGAAFLLVLYALAVLLRIRVKGYPFREQQKKKKAKEKRDGKA